MKIIFTSFFITFIALNSFSQSGWVLQNSNIRNNINDIFFINSQTGWAVADSTKILHTTNGGNNWTHQSFSYYGSLNTIFFINENTGWAGGGFYYIVHSGIIYKTTNGGENWNIASYQSEITDMYFINENTGFIGLDLSGDFSSAGAIIKTINGGINWNLSGSMYLPFVISCVYFEENTGWACGYYWDDTGGDTDIVLKTTDIGNSWLIKYKEPGRFHSRADEIFAIENNVWLAGIDSIILMSTNFGDSWIKSYLSPVKDIKTIFFINNHTGWIGGSRFPDTTTIMKTTNSGFNWFNLRNIYLDGVSSIFFINENTGWATGGYYYTENGMILKTTTGGITNLSNQQENIPSGIELRQNFPNPFNPSTTIQFDIKKSTQATLKIYDMQGKLVKVLFEGNINPGTYKTEWDAAGFASGIYLYTLEIEGLNITKRMTLLK
ncbi:MAG: Ycf48-like protein [Ignavibacteria bacterium]|nr:Ycf48-like protein [Ignavibacteria bacterium]